MLDNFDQVIDRRGTESAKWRIYPDDVLPLWVADMDFMSPEPVRRALREAVDHGVFGYPRGLHGDATDLPEYAQTIVERLRDRYAWHVEPQDVIFLPGVVVGLSAMCNMFRAQGGSIAVQPPVYTPILDVPQIAGLTRTEALLDAPARWDLRSRLGSIRCGAAGRHARFHPLQSAQSGGTRLSP